MNPNLINPGILGPRIRGSLNMLLISGSIALLALVISIFAGLSKDPANINNIPTIAVTGSGESTVIPDVAEFSFTVEKKAAAVADAQNAATALANQAIAALKQGGVADTDIKTTNYGINPNYVYTNQSSICPANGCPPVRQIIDGYTVSQTIDVKVEKTASTGQLLQTIGQLGVTNVGGVSFTTKDKNAGQDQARAAAIAEAQQKAQMLAKQLGVRLGKVINFQEAGNYPSPVYYASAAGMSKDASVAPMLPTGQNTITENVTITYEIR